MSPRPEEEDSLSVVKSGSQAKGKMVRVMIFPSARGTTGWMLRMFRLRS